MTTRKVVSFAKSVSPSGTIRTPSTAILFRSPVYFEPAHAIIAHNRIMQPSAYEYDRMPMDAVVDEDDTLPMDYNHGYMEELLDTGEAEVDIVAVYDPAVDQEQSWITTKEGPRTTIDGRFLWSIDHLESVASTSIRVFAFRYSLHDLLVAGIDAVSRTLVERVEVWRGREPNDCERPIVYVARGLGGLVVKRALILAEKEKSGVGGIYLQTEGVAFLGTPHYRNEQEWQAAAVHYAQQVDIRRAGDFHAKDVANACRLFSSLAIMTRPKRLRVYNFYSALEHADYVSIHHTLVFMLSTLPTGSMPSFHSLGDRSPLC
jgi:hypothetical protein